MTLTLGFFQLSELCLEGCPQGPAGSLSLAPSGQNAIAVDFRSEAMSFRGAAGSMMVEGISPRTAGLAPVRGPRLFSYPNVWNSCLLLARLKGFSIRLVGHPDERGSISWCRWRATKGDGAELTANNPIELAGLIALYEHHQPQQDKAYWWRIEGPDLVTELHQQWAASYFGRQSPGSDVAT